MTMGQLTLAHVAHFGVEAVTRINLGIRPPELCDQHLIAEYKELPRAFAHKGRVLAGPFRLNKGHVIWCSQFPGTLAKRYRSLVREMRYRGFVVNYPEPRGDGAIAPRARVSGAREIVSERILRRLEIMSESTRPSDHPRWTKRRSPKWARPALEKRSKKVLDSEL